MIETACKPFQSLAESALIGLASVPLVARLGHAVSTTGTHAGLMQKQPLSTHNPKLNLLEEKK
jgi:hypothetical protein